MSILFLTVAPYDMAIGAFVITYLSLVAYDVIVLVTCVKVLFSLGE